MTREIGPELVARIRKFADSLEAIARGEVVLLYSTPQTHATPGGGSVPRAYGKPDAKRTNSDTERGSVAWLAVATDGSESSAVYLLKEQADAAAREWGWMTVPLYRSPALTDEEREAIGYFAMFHSSPREADAKHGKTLRSLLGRMA